MNSQILLPLILLVVLSTNAFAEGEASASSSGVPPLVPVNQMSRFLLTGTAPRLANSETGSIPGAYVLRAGEFRIEDHSVLTQVPEVQGKSAVWVQMNNYWIEPVTPPPSQGDAIVVPIDDMRIAEVQGEVTARIPSQEKRKKDEIIDANENMEVPVGAIIETEDSGSAAIMVGGHTSVRVVPNSRVQLNYDATTATPCLEVKILKGAAFCKVGKLPTGRYADVGVRGPVGSLATIGSADFFVQADPVSLHICLLQGKLLVGGAIPLAVGNMNWYPADVVADSRTGPQLYHWPHPSSDPQKAAADGVTLNFALHQIQMLNVKINALMNSQGQPLSSDDQAYLAQVPRVTWYAKATSENP